MDYINPSPQEIAETLKLLEGQATTFSQNPEYDRESVALAQRFSNLYRIALNRARAKGVTPEKKESFKRTAEETRAKLAVFLNTVIFSQLIPTIEKALDSPADEADEPKDILMMIQDLSHLWYDFSGARPKDSPDIATIIDDFETRCARLMDQRNEMERDSRYEQSN